MEGEDEENVEAEKEESFFVFFRGEDSIQIKARNYDEKYTEEGIEHIKRKKYR